MEELAGGTAASGIAAAAQELKQQQQQGVKRHHHKHNLKHRYELQETLGKGTYGKVKRAIERFSGRVVAIKSIRKDKIKDEQDMVHIRREIEIMSSLSHPHIITIYEVKRGQKEEGEDRNTKRKNRKENQTYC